jgi:hypothetical protein
VSGACRYELGQGPEVVLQCDATPHLPRHFSIFSPGGSTVRWGILHGAVRESTAATHKHHLGINRLKFVRGMAPSMESYVRGRRAEWRAPEMLRMRSGWVVLWFCC